jgi:agmatine deiminase
MPITMNYTMPAEWHLQTATWTSWPHNVETWPDNLDEAQAEFVAFVKTIAQYQPVKVMCGEIAKSTAGKSLAEVERIQLIDIPTNDAWARDYAPTFVKVNGTGELAVINWHYNAWGGKYPPYDDDQQVATRVAEHIGLPIVSPDLCFEGGAIEINDSGLMLCTRSCALDPNRNPGKTVSVVENIFRETLGAEEIIWLSGDAIEGDDTDGHIDQLARFTDDHTIVYAWCDDETDPQHAGLATNLDDLKTGISQLGSAKTNGDKIRLIPLPIPSAINLCDRRVPASYCNFLIGNGVVIVPQFGDIKFDRIAMETLTPLFPDREVIGLDSLNLSVGLGSFHCLSQQQPM